MKNSILFIACIGMISFFWSCNATTESETNTPINTKPVNEEVTTPLVKSVMTAEKQSELTPEEVLNMFKEGNERFMKNELTNRDLPAQVKATSSGQYPKAIVLSCVDSRVPVENVLDVGIGDIFVARVAGNFVNEDILGSMEFATKVAGSKLVVVMGHEHCGAVKAAIDDVVLGNITGLLAKIKPAVDAVPGFENKRTSKDQEFVASVVGSNVGNTINEIREKSPILKEMEENGEIKIVGGVYDLDTGKIEFMEM
ncbi:MAG: carbonic anhydrase family protein [Bacteroidota bacterium]